MADGLFERVTKAPRNMKKLRFLALPAIAAAMIFAWNYFGAHRPVSQRLAKDERNEKVRMWAHYQYGLMPSVLVLDLRGFTEEAAALDVMRALLQSAEGHKDHRFNRVVLAYKGTGRLQLEGTYYQTLGQEYEKQNPIYTLRTLPENVYRLDGTKAYGSWSGGMLGVLAKQMEDLGQFSKDWYQSEAVREPS